MVLRPWVRLWQWSPLRRRVPDVSWEPMASLSPASGCLSAFPTADSVRGRPGPSFSVNQDLIYHPALSYPFTSNVLLPGH